MDKDKGLLPSDLTEMIEVRIARLVKDQTGCTAERAIRLTTKEASESELEQAMSSMETVLSEKLGKSVDSEGMIPEGDEHIME